MKPIRITKENAAAIEAALREVNGKATSHTYTTFSEIEGVAQEAEGQAIKLLKSKKELAGAFFDSTSGGAVSNAYAKKSSSRTATGIGLARRPTGWVLTYVSRREIGQSGGGSGRLTLTQAQADLAVQIFKIGFHVLTPWQPA